MCSHESGLAHLAAAVDALACGWCDAHHIVHWPDGGPTSLGNLILMCRFHHRYVHEAGWQIKTTPDGHHEFIPPDQTRHRPDDHPRPPPAA
ncbi:MAG: HNH endonuclease signature motif containing protein [Streptosporangiaceae bacterium]